MSVATDILNEFVLPGAVTAVERLGRGHINDSYKIVAGAGLGERSYLLQRLNSSIFPDPVAIMGNVIKVASHLSQVSIKVKAPGWDTQRHALQFVSTRSGVPFFQDSLGGVWRLARFIENTKSAAEISTPEEAHEAGKAVGRFHRFMVDFTEPLEITLPGFHDTPQRLAFLKERAREDQFNRAAKVRPELNAVAAMSDDASLITRMLESGELPSRIAHNDAKVDNILFDRVSGKSLCMVDLDTVQPGSILHDLGDLLRSSATRASEDELSLTRVIVRSPVVKAALDGFVEETKAILTPAEKKHLILAGQTMALEQAARFLSDYLHGDTYYPTSRPDHNLDRARVQLKIAQGLAALR